MRSRFHKQRRSGNVLLLTLLLMVPMFAMLAFSIDVGYLNVVRTDLQRTADAAAMASAWKLIDEGGVSGNANTNAMITRARTTAQNYAAMNPVSHKAINLPDGDIEVGYLSSLTDSGAMLNVQAPLMYNAVRVTTRRTSSQNGEVPFFFARVLGFASEGMQATATAAMNCNFRGFQIPSSGENLAILPYALDEQTWLELQAGNASDNYQWDSATSSIGAGSDGVREVNLFPQGTGAPGNRGTVDIGNSNNSTADIRRQILHGISPSDLAHHGGKLELNEYGTLELNGDTGISAGVENDLQAIVGEPRIIPIFRAAAGPGNNAQYSIVQFVGVRIMHVNLSGSASSKQVIVQPANIVVRGGIPSSTPGQTTYVFSPAQLVR